MKFQEIHKEFSDKRFERLVRLEQFIKMLSDEGKISVHTSSFLIEELNNLYKEPLWLAIEQMKDKGLNEFSETIAIYGNINSLLTITLKSNL